MPKALRVRAFAAQNGVTVKALQHYDRLGLLRPGRTASGHRVYSAHERERLRHILVLKAIGIPLARVAAVIDGDGAALAEVLRTQRQTLEMEQSRLIDAVRAIELVENGLVDAPRPGHALSELADMLAVRSQAESMRQYFSADTWVRCRAFYADFPGPWATLFADVLAAAPDGPATEAAERLLARSYRLWREWAGDDPALLRQFRDGFGKAWMDRRRWPEALRHRFAAHRVEEVSAFLGRAAMVALQRRGASFFEAFGDTAGHAA